MIRVSRPTALYPRYSLHGRGSDRRFASIVAEGVSPETVPLLADYLADVPGDPATQVLPWLVAALVREPGQSAPGERGTHPLAWDLFRAYARHVPPAAGEYSAFTDVLDGGYGVREFRILAACTGYPNVWVPFETLVFQAIPDREENVMDAPGLRLPLAGKDCRARCRPSSRGPVVVAEILASALPVAIVRRGDTDAARAAAALGL